MDNVSDQSKKDVGGFFKFLTIMLMFLNIFVNGLASVSGDIKSIPEFMGSITAPVIFGLIVVAFFQIWRRFRTSAARYKILFITFLLLLIGSCGRLINPTA